MTTEQSSYASMMHLHGTSMSQEQILWLHVLAQLLLDVTSKQKQIKRDVVDWMASEDFEIVCGMAGVNPIYMHRLFTVLAGDRNKKRAFKKAMEFRFLVRSYVEANSGDADK